MPGEPTMVTGLELPVLFPDPGPLGMRGRTQRGQFHHQAQGFCHLCLRNAASRHPADGAHRASGRDPCRLGAVVPGSPGPVRPFHLAAVELHAPGSCSGKRPACEEGAAGTAHPQRAGPGRAEALAGDTWTCCRGAGAGSGAQPCGAGALSGAWGQRRRAGCPEASQRRLVPWGKATRQNWGQSLHGFRGFACPRARPAATCELPVQRASSGTSTSRPRPASAASAPPPAGLSARPSFTRTSRRLAPAPRARLF